MWLHLLDIVYKNCVMMGVYSLKMIVVCIHGCKYCNLFFINYITSYSYETILVAVLTSAVGIQHLVI